MSIDATLKLANPLDNLLSTVACQPRDRLKIRLSSMACLTGARKELAAIPGRLSVRICSELSLKYLHAVLDTSRQQARPVNPGQAVAVCSDEREPALRHHVSSNHIGAINAGLRLLGRG